jgi:hypothetical protein
MSPFLAKSEKDENVVSPKKQELPVVDFTNDVVSEESSDEE